MLQCPYDMKNIQTLVEKIEVARCFPTNKSRQFGTKGEVLGGAGEDFLASIHGEIGDWKENEAAALKEYREEQNRLVDIGLTTEINTSKELMPIDEIVDRCQAILRRHPYGYKGGVNRIEDPKGAREQAAESVEATE